MTEFHFESNVVALPKGAWRKTQLASLRNPVVTEA